MPAIQPRAAQRQMRCAIHTRKSVEQGFEIEFNSLESQRSICSAYIMSQRHRGWTEQPKHYDDGGESGASLIRPALQELLADVERGMIDVVVIYKLDRLTTRVASCIKHRSHFAFSISVSPRLP